MTIVENTFFDDKDDVFRKDTVSFLDANLDEKMINVTNETYINRKNIKNCVSKDVGVP